MVESKYWIWPSKETAELRTETLADPGPDELLVKTRYSAVSPGTEMALYMMTHVGFPDPTNRYAKYPHRGGYLTLGIVEKAGAEAAEKVPVGSWVYTSSPHGQYALVKADPLGTTAPLPENLHNPETALLGLARIGYAAPFVARTGLGELVVVFGGGMVGNFAAQLYRVAGAEVVLVEKDDFRRGIAEACGLETLSSIEQVPARFPEGPSLVVEATGVPQLSVEAMKTAAAGGRVVILSSPRGEAPVNFYSHIHAKLLTVIGAHAKVVPGDATHRLIVRLASKGDITFKPCLTHVVSWKDAPKIWDIYAHGAPNRLGTVFDWEM